MPKKAGDIPGVLVAPFERRFISDVNMVNKIANNFYSKKDELYQARQSELKNDKFYQNEKDKDTPLDTVTGFLQRYVNSQNTKSITPLYAAKRQIESDTKLSRNEKGI